MKEKKSELLLRVYILFFTVLAVAIVLFLKTAQIAIVEGDRWSAKGDSLYLKYVSIEADRGNILSEDSRLMATSIPFFEIRMDLNCDGLTDELFNQHIDSLSYYLSRLVYQDQSKEQVKQRLKAERKRGSRYMLVKRKVNYEELEKIKKFPLFRLGRNTGGLIVVRKSQRQMPFKSLANRTIGKVGEGAKPVGLEGYFDSTLSGEAGKKLMQRVAYNTYIPVNNLTEIEPKSGADIQTTINLDMQDIAHNSLKDALKHHNAQFGTAIIMEVETGAIKAIANLGKSKYGYVEDTNHAIGEAFEPGSTFKLPSIMALMDDGLAGPNTKVNLENGQTRFYDRYMRDSHFHGLDEVNMEKAFEISSNVGIAKLVNQLYRRQNNSRGYLRKLRQFHLDRKTGIEVMGEADAFVKNPDRKEDNWSGITLPWMSIGYEVEVTAIQMLNFYNAVANDGKMMKPYLVSKVFHEGELVKEFKPRVLNNQIAKESTIEHAQTLLENVVVRGTAKRLKSNQYDFAGKTGTAWFDYDIEAQTKKYRASFIGYFPADKPKYSIMVLISDPKQNGFYGGAVAGPVFRSIADQLHAYDTDFAKSFTKAESNWANSEKVFNSGYKSDFKKLNDTLGFEMNFPPTGNWVNIESEAHSLIAERIAFNKSKLPDVVGMGLRDAIYILENVGAHVELSGSGKVKEQTIRKKEGLQTIVELKLE